MPGDLSDSQLRRWMEATLYNEPWPNHVSQIYLSSFHTKHNTMKTATTPNISKTMSSTDHERTGGTGTAHLITTPRARRESAPASLPSQTPSIECDICKDVIGKRYDDGRVEHEATTLCGHVFGHDCLMKWADQHGDQATCPKCRRLLDGREPGTLPRRILEQAEEIMGGFDTYYLHDNGFWQFEISDPLSGNPQYVQYHPSSDASEGDGNWVQGDDVEDYLDEMEEEEWELRWAELAGAEPDIEAFCVALDELNLTEEEEQRRIREFRVEYAEWAMEWCGAEDGPVLTLEMDFPSWCSKMVRFLREERVDEGCPNDTDKMTDFISTFLLGIEVSQLSGAQRAAITAQMTLAGEK